MSRCFGPGLKLGAGVIAVACLAPVSAEEASPPATPLEVIHLPDRQDPLTTYLESPAFVELDTIIVTARRREENVDDVPVSVSSVSSSQLHRQAVSDTRQLEAAVPGLSVAELGFNRPVYSLRGIGYSDTSPTALSAVSIYLDEQLYPFDVMSTGPNVDLDRVEVIKGPQGVLYGRNTTGGAINYIANKPTDTFESALSGSYGTFETFDAEGFVSGPLADGLRGRLALRSITRGEGWQESMTRPGDHLGRQEKQSLRGMLDWDARENLQLSFLMQGWRDESDPQAGQVIAIDPQNPTGGSAFVDPAVQNHPTVSPSSDNIEVADWAPYPWQLHNRFGMVSIKSDWTVTDQVNLISHIGRYRFRSDDSAIPQSGLSLLNIESVIDTSMLATVAESRLIGHTDGGIDWQLGVHYARDTLHQNQLFLADNISALFPLTSTGEPNPVLLALIDPLLPVEPGQSLITNRFETEAHQRSHALAFLGDIDFPLSDQVIVELGARYTLEERDFRGCLHDSDQRTEGLGLANLATAVLLARVVTNTGSPVPTQFPEGTECVTANPQTNQSEEYHGSLDEDTLSWRTSLSWTPTETLLLYASYDRGFKSGNFPVLIASDASQMTPVTKERLDAYEMGLKHHISNLVTHLAVFFYDYDDKQLLSRTTDPIFGTLAKLRNAPRSRLYGAEADVTYRFAQHWQAFVSAAYLDSKVLEFEGINENGDLQDFAGSHFNLAPKYSAAIGLDTAYPMTWRNGILHASADYGYKSKTRTSLTAGPLFEHRIYRRLDASVGYALEQGRWDVTLWGYNLLDALSTQGVYDPSDSIVRYTGMPRTIGVALRYEWM